MFDAVVDIVIFGHTHYPVVEEFPGILMVNPGSPSLPNQLRRLGQVAVIELEPAHKRAEIPRALHVKLGADASERRTASEMI